MNVGKNLLSGRPEGILRIRLEWQYRKDYRPQCRRDDVCVWCIEPAYGNGTAEWNPNDIQTTYAYDAEDQITEVRTTCFCGHLISSYTYEYNESGYVSKETAKECLFTSDQGYGHKGGEIWSVP